MSAIPAPVPGPGRPAAARKAPVPKAAPPPKGPPRRKPLASSAKPAADPAATARQILNGLNGEIEPVRVGILYRAGLLLVALAMLVLPLIYVALIAAVGYGIYYHAVENVTIFEGRGNGKGRLLAYVAPLVVGGVLLLFLVKPLFARKGKQSHPLSVTREDQPLLFAFVDRLCEVVGAPKPRRIDVDTDVNASAGFLNGSAGLLTNRLVLTIG